MDFNAIGLNWDPPELIEGAESGDTVGTLTWLGTTYNIIKAIRKWRPVYDWDDDVSFWLDQDLSVIDFIKEENSEITNEDIWKSLGLSLNPIYNSDFFFNALMTSEAYKIFMHPAMQLPTMDDFGRYFNNGKPSYDPAHEAIQNAYNAINFNEPINGHHRYWVHPPYVTGGFWDSEIISKSTSQRTVGIKQATEGGGWSDGFNYVLHYFYKRRLFFFKNGQNYEEFTFPDFGSGYDLTESDIEDALDTWLQEHEIAEPGTTNYTRIFWGASIAIWLILYLIDWRRQINEGEEGFLLPIWEFGTNNWYWQLQMWGLLVNLSFITIARDLEDLDPHASAAIRPKINNDFVPIPPPRSTFVTDPIFFGSGY